MRKLLAGAALLLVFAAGVGYGFVASRRHWFPYGPLKAASRAFGRPSPHVAMRWNRRNDHASALAERDAVEALVALPYLEGYRPGTGKEGVTAYDPSRALDGWNLCVSAHAAEARLLDMKGTLRHRWALDARRAWPDLKEDPDNRDFDKFWRRARLLPGGDLLVVWEYFGIARIDSHSRLRWASLCGAHHDFDVDREGRIYVLTRQKKVLPDVNPDAAVFEDFVTTLTPEGRVVRSVSLLRALERSDYAALLANMPREGDLLHANSVQVLDGALAPRGPAFREGNLLVSLRSMNLVAILDPREERVVWALTGQWRAQHAVRLLETGRMLLFDNFVRLGQSRALEIDPLTQEIVWRYGESEAQRFFSEASGETQRLSNGNTLITVSDEGRALEVTPGGDVVWAYENPFRAGEKKELIATLHQVERLPSDLGVDAWADPRR